MFSSPELRREAPGVRLPWLEVSLKTRRIGLRPALLSRGDDLKGATRRRGNFGFGVLRASAIGDQDVLKPLFSFASIGLTARTTSNGDKGECGDAFGERVDNCNRVGLDGERDNDLLSFCIAMAS